MTPQRPTTRRRAGTGEDVLVRRAAVRLGLQAAASVSVVVLLVTAAATTVLLRAEQRGATDLLDATIALADDVDDPPLDIWLVIRGAGRQQSTAGLPAGSDAPRAVAAVAAGAPAEDEEHRVDGVDYRVATVRRRDGVTVQAVLDLTARQDDRWQVLTAMVVTGLVGLLLAAAVGTLLSLRALRPLSAALALQRRFVADAGHELRTPLTLLGTRAQLLRRRLRRVHDGVDAPGAWREATHGASGPGRAGAEPGPGPAGPGSEGAGPTGAGEVRVAELALRDVEGVVADSARLTAILEDLLLAADPLARRARGPVDLVRICDDVVRAAAADAAARGVELTGSAPPDPPVEVVGSAVALHRAVTALVDNALRHARSAVSVTVRHRRGDVLVDVVDDGPGVDPALVPRLFTRFAGGPPTGRPTPRRHGLGLALVAEIVAAHGGSVAFLEPAAPAAGPPRTDLRVTLPARPAAPRRRGGPAVP